MWCSSSYCFKEQGKKFMRQNLCRKINSQFYSRHITGVRLSDKYLQCLQNVLTNTFKKEKSKNTDKNR